MIFFNSLIKILQKTIVSSSTAHGWFIKSHRQPLARDCIVVFLLQSRPPESLLANFCRARLQHKRVCEEAKEQYCETLACIKVSYSENFYLRILLLNMSQETRLMLQNGCTCFETLQAMCKWYLIYMMQA